MLPHTFVWTIFSYFFLSNKISFKCFQKVSARRLISKRLKPFTNLLPMRPIWSRQPRLAVSDWIPFAQWNRGNAHQIKRQFQATGIAFGAPRSRLWNQRGIRLVTIYRAVNIWTLETAPQYRRDIKLLTILQCCHLRCIMHISWKDNISNAEVHTIVNISNVEALLAAARPRWNGNVYLLDNSRLSKISLYGEQKCMNRRRGGQRLCYKECMYKERERCRSM